MSAIEDFKKAWRELELEEAKSGFFAHFISYVIVNAFLVFVNMYTSPGYMWFLWVLSGWGVGLAFHFAFSRERFVISRWEEKVARIELRMRRTSGNM